MAAGHPQGLGPRKRPRQTRSAETLDVILEATVQVLIAEGPRSLTTTRVARRAGVSVGSVYQYFPNKQALIYAVNERYLDQLADRIEAVCASRHGASVHVMVEALLDAYWHAKTERVDVTMALYRSVVELDNEALIAAFAARVDGATLRMLESADDADLPDPGRTVLTLLTVIFGTVRNAFERRLDGRSLEALRLELLSMCRSYLVRSSVDTASDAPPTGEDPRLSAPPPRA